MHDFTDETRGAASIVLSQLAIFFVWMTGLVIAGKVAGRGPRNSFDVFIASLGDPRRFVYVGFALHALALALGVIYRGTEVGKTLEEVGISGGAGSWSSRFCRRGMAVPHPNERASVALFVAHPAATALRHLKEDSFLRTRQVLPASRDHLLFPAWWFGVFRSERVCSARPGHGENRLRSAVATLPPRAGRHRLPACLQLDGESVLSR